MEKPGAAQQWDVCIVGGGAAGLMAGIWACRTAPQQRILLLDGAKNLGAKILISGGGRCNVTHESVDETSFSGSSPMAIRKVLRRFGVAECIGFFRELGVELVREDTGKLFPREGRARGVLEALLGEARRAGLVMQHPRKVQELVPLAPPFSGSPDDALGSSRRALPASGDEDSSGFRLAGAWGCVEARRVILATGGRSVPKTGSDGSGYEIVRRLGHSVSALLPGLVPLTLRPDHFLCALRGIAVPVELALRSGTGKRLCAVQGPLLCTHFGVSGPAVLDMSRHFLAAQRADPKVTLLLQWVLGISPEQWDRELQDLQSGSVVAFLARRLPERLARALSQAAGVDPARRGSDLRRVERRGLVQLLTAMPLPATGSRGFAVAEVTAGGVPLSEVRLETMESRLQRGLFLCGEILDVDGRIGGFNFQWAWASAFVAGGSAAQLS